MRERFETFSHKTDFNPPEGLHVAHNVRTQSPFALAVGYMLNYMPRYQCFGGNGYLGIKRRMASS